MSAEGSRLSFPYGENPHQGSACVRTLKESGLLPFRVLGRAVSYNNVADALLAWSLASDLRDLGDWEGSGTDLAVSVKYGRPVGIAFAEGPRTSSRAAGAGVGSAVATAAALARATKPDAAIHDWLAVTCDVDRTAAEQLLAHRADGIVAPGFAPGVADALLDADDHLRLLEMDPERFRALPHGELEVRTLFGLQWEQEPSTLRVTREWPLPAEGQDSLAGTVRHALLAALLVCKYTPARAVCAMQGRATRVVAGACQSERESMTMLAGLLATNGPACSDSDLVACSSVSITERDSIRIASRAGIRYLLQPAVPSPELLEEGRRHQIVVLGSGVRLIRR